MTQQAQAARRGVPAAVVTGAAGFIGSHLVPALARQGRPVTAVDRTWTRTRLYPDGPADLANLADPADPEPSGVRHVAGDLATMDLAPLLNGAETVFHLAARPGVRSSWDDFPACLRDNVQVTERLLAACHRAGVPRLVLASSSSVYGEGPGREQPMAEDQLPCPVSPYGVTKLAAERLGSAYAARPGSPLTVVSLRFFTVYGPGQRPDMLTARVIRSVLDGTSLPVYGDGSQSRDFSYVGDVVRALLLAQRPHVPGGAYNVGAGRRTTVLELCAAVGEAMGRPPLLEHTAPQPGDAFTTLADPSRAARVLGYRAATGLREGIAAQVAATVRAASPGIASGAPR
ncbi:NAD-dependent epimerase/dehydratase family protein [Streptomyces sp. NPDC057654]|uniref:NAD-dependent epimerase/dehydratase family protein n=1 Tax=Streptomyces sp. NPDC057654 TaxID=3346196 RepID=UPI0036AF20CC